MPLCTTADRTQVVFATSLAKAIANPDILKRCDPLERGDFEQGRQ